MSKENELMSEDFIFQMFVNTFVKKINKRHAELMKQRVIDSLFEFSKNGQLPDSFYHTDEEILGGLNKWYNETYYIRYQADDDRGSREMSKEKEPTAVEFLAERYNYITWMRNRDEISAGIADEWRDRFLREAKEMEEQQELRHEERCKEVAKAAWMRATGRYVDFDPFAQEEFEKWYNETYEK